MCPGLRATVEFDAEVEVDGLTLGFISRLVRRFDDCSLETPFDLISKYFFIVGVSGAVKLRISHQYRAAEGTPGNDRPVHSARQQYFIAFKYFPTELPHICISITSRTANNSFDIASSRVLFQIWRIA